MNLAEWLNVELAGLILALLALVIGLYHVIEIRRVMARAKIQADEAKSHTDALEEVRRTLSTRYIGKFPEYYGEIVSLIERAKNRIVIFCDYPAYGSFSDPDTWLTYHQTLQRKLLKDDVLVELTCLNETRRKRSVEEQFFDPDNTWEDCLKNPDFRKKLEDLLNKHPKAPALTALTQTDFAEVLEADEHNALDDLATAKICEIDSYMPLYFWLIDDISAVFSLPSFSEKALEYGFATTDQRLIAALLEMRDRYYRSFGNPPANNRTIYELIGQ